MSLIERALGKAKQAGQDRGPGSTSRRPVLKAPEPRVFKEPQLWMTGEIRQRLGIADNGDAEHQRASEYRHIKRQLVAEIRANPSQRVLLVASALAGEGKSFMSANLAYSLAREPDYTVLLIDADVVKPQLTKAMKLADRPGLMNVLVDPSQDIESLVLATDIEGLSVLPAGMRRGRPARTSSRSGMVPVRANCSRRK